jgi:RNA polymerase sigma-70 factor (ECF subfamily)
VKVLAHSPDDDAHYVQRLADGDVDALGPLYERYGGAVRSMLARVEPKLGREGADDLCQEVFLTFVDTVGRYEERGRLRSWLYGIAVRKVQAWRRRGWVRRLLGKQHGSAVSGVALMRDRTEEQIAARQRIDLILKQLPDTQRAVVILRLVEGLSAEETAEVLGISVNAVGTRLHRARRSLEAS